MFGGITPVLVLTLVAALIVIIYLTLSAGAGKKSWADDVAAVKARSAAHGEHVHVHPPGVPPEDVELAGRRIGAAFMIFAGVILFIGAIPLGIAIALGNDVQSGLIGGIIPFILGIILLSYGGYLWDKYKHVSWTKQALREFDQQRLHVQQDTMRQQAELEAMERRLRDEIASLKDNAQSVKTAAASTIVATAKLILPDNSELSLALEPRWIGRADLEKFIQSGNVKFISRQHCLIDFATGKYYIEDQNSANGTRLNGHEIKGKGKLELKDGDVIELANEAKLAFRVI